MFPSQAPGTTALLPVPSLAGDAGPTASWRYDGVLAGMIAKGHGLAAISAYLGDEAATVLERVLMRGLTTPHEKPLRVSHHPKAWPVADFRCLIDYWLDGWKASSVATVFGRSVGSIYAQVRRLGLPRRPRRELHHPSDDLVERIRRDRAFPGHPSDGARDAADPNLIRIITLENGELLRIERKPNRNEVNWTPELLAHVSDRGWANQHYKAIGDVLGISHRAVCTRLSMLGIPPHNRKDLVDHYDPEVGKERLRLSGYKWRECQFLKGQFFWASHRGETISKLAKKSKAFHQARQTAF